MNYTKSEKIEAEKFIKEFGNPLNTPITFIQKLFFPKEYFYIREAVYHYVKCKGRRGNERRRIML